VNSRDIELTDNQLDKLKKWCLSTLDKVDFKFALRQEGKSITTTDKFIFLHYFLRKYKFNYPKEKLLDMISFGWQETGVDYLEEYLSIEEITERILINLKANQNNAYELRNYFGFCLKHRITAIKEYAMKEIINVSRDKDIRKLALELLKSLIKDNRTIFSLMKKVQDSFKCELIELLYNNNYNALHEYLIKILRNGPIEDQTLAANYLMRMQDLEGLKFYTEKLEKEKIFENNWHRSRAITYIKNPKAIIYLLRLLKLAYDKDLKEDNYDSLYRVVENIFTNIALTNEQNFKKVYKSINTFIKENNKKDEKINFLYSYLERLERQFYFTKSQKITLDEALSKLKMIDS